MLELWGDGSQYASDKYQKMLSTIEMISSMSGKGEYWDNALTEQFFRSFKVSVWLTTPSSNI
ncbi:hypothetical protein [Moritella viscosa]|nr:hypothetical protein [Moritella viscosa]